MVIYPSGLVASAAAAGTPLTNPRILYASHARDLAASAVTVSTEAADGPKDAPLRPDTAEYWQPTALPATWTVDLGAAKDIDAIGILGTFGSSGCAVEARLSDEATNFDSYLSLPGTSGNYASTPDSAAVSITGDIDLRARAALVDWTPPVADNVNLIAKWWTTGTYYLAVDAAGTLRLVWVDAASVMQQRVSTVATGITDGATKWARGTLDVDNGAAGHDVKFWLSDDYNPATGAGTWTQLGATVTTAGVTSIRDTADPVEIGSRVGGAAGNVNGRIYYAELRNGIAGPVVAKFNPDDATSDGATSFTSGTGEVWTINQSGTPKATLVVRRFASAIAPADDAPILFLDALRSKRYLRLNVTGGSTMPKLSVVYAEKALAMQRAIYGGHGPINLNRETEMHGAMSRGGQFLGQGFRRHGVVGTAAFRHLTASWYRANFDAFVKSARQYPFFFAWRPATFDKEVACAWCPNDIRVTNMGKRDFMEVSLSMAGVGHV